VDSVTTLLFGGSEPLRIACSASSPEVTTFPEWELGFRLLDGREDSDAEICAFRASLTTRSTNRLPNDRKNVKQPVRDYLAVHRDVPCFLPGCNGFFHRRVHPEAADGGFFPAGWTCCFLTELASRTLQEVDY